MRKVKITERGWPGHFIASQYCIFRRNTLLECKNIKVVVSTVGKMVHPLKEHEYCKIGTNHYYETMAFLAKRNGNYWDADVSKQIYFKNKSHILSINEDDDENANQMHENVVKEIAQKLQQDNLYSELS